MNLNPREKLSCLFKLVEPFLFWELLQREVGSTVQCKDGTNTNIEKKNPNRHQGGRIHVIIQPHICHSALGPIHPHKKILFPLADKATNILTAKSKEHRKNLEKKYWIPRKHSLPVNTSTDCKLPAGQLDETQPINEASSIQTLTTRAGARR